MRSWGTVPKAGSQTTPGGAGASGRGLLVPTPGTAATIPILPAPAAQAVAKGQCERGIVICTTGIGVSITANKVKGIRCALLSDLMSARLTRQHNDANMMALGAGVVGGKAGPGDGGPLPHHPPSKVAATPAGWTRSWLWRRINLSTDLHILDLPHLSTATCDVSLGGLFREK